MPKQDDEPLPQLPEDVGLEQSLLGSCLVDASALDDVAYSIEPQHFYDPLHNRVFAAMMQMWKDRRPATPLTVAALLEGDAGLADVGGKAYLISLARAAPALPDVKEYARILRDIATRRSLINLGQTIAEEAQRPTLSASPREIVGRAQESLFKLLERDVGIESVGAGEAALRGLERGDLVRQGKAPGGVPTGLRTLKEAIGDLSPRELIVVAGRPGMGKSSMMGTLALAAAKCGYPTEIISLEMTSEQLAIRLAADLDYDSRLNGYGSLAYARLLKGWASEAEFARATAAAVQISQMPLTIHDASGMTMGQICALGQSRAARAGKLGLLLIDHLHIVSSAGFQRSRADELSEMTKQAKDLAKRVGWPVVLLAQLNRSGEGSGRDTERRPQLSDLRGSGGIEENADVVLGLYRPGYYVSIERPKCRHDDPRYGEWVDKMKSSEHDFEVIVLKQRNGATPTVDLYCDMKASVVRDLGSAQRQSSDVELLV